MSSHREAPAISKDPAADNTDVYAFIDSNDPTKVNLICSFNPFEIPYGGPNFSEFDDDVLYTINISNDGTSKVNIQYQFRFHTTIRNPNTFLYNTGQITSIGSANWNRPQTYDIGRILHNNKTGKVVATTLARGLTVPPCNVGDRSTPDYEANLGSQAVHSIAGGRKVFAGQRSDSFFVDLGSIFDLGGLRPLNQAHLIPLAAMAGENGLMGMNVHTIALQVPISELAIGGKAPTDASKSTSVIGVWSSTYRTSGRLFDAKTATYKGYGRNAQISRLGNPLFNEVINPMATKDKWNNSAPYTDSAYAKYVTKPEFAGLLPVLYPAKDGNPSPFAKLAAYKKPRADLAAILLTGIPASVLGGKVTTYTGPVQADMLRLNLAVPPTAKGSENNLGVVAGDTAGFPNGRRVIDDVTTIEIRAIAGLTIPLVDPTFTPDDIVAKGDSLRDGSTYTNLPLLDRFPYLAPPASGYGTTPPVPAAS